MKTEHYETLYNYESTHWWYRVRRELVYKLIIRYSLCKSNIQILDVGCGTGELMRVLEPLGTVTGIDMSEQAINFCRQRGLKNLRKESCPHLSFSDNSFDVVLALDVLEHIDDDAQAVRELTRVLKPGGILIIFVPAFMFLWGITDILSEHKRRYTKRGLLTVLRQNQLHIERTSYFNFFLFFPILLIRTLARSNIIHTKNENMFTNKFLNKLLYGIFHTEGKMLLRMSFPFGVSIMSVVRKESK